MLSCCLFLPSSSSSSSSSYSLACFSRITRAVISKMNERHNTFYLTATFISLANTQSLTHAVTVTTMCVTELLLLPQCVPHIEHSRNDYQGNSSAPRTEWKMESSTLYIHTYIHTYTHTHTHTHTGCSAKRVSDFRMLDEPFWVKNSGSLSVLTATSISVYVLSCNWKFLNAYVLSYFTTWTDIYLSGSTTTEIYKNSLHFRYFILPPYAFSSLRYSLQ